MFYQSKYSIPDSHHVINKDIVQLKTLDINHEISTTWILNRNLQKNQLDRIENEIVIYCKQYNLTVIPDHLYHLKVTGTITNFEKALDVKINNYQKNEHVYFASSIPIKIPIRWKGKVDDILGLNTEKIAFPHFQKMDPISQRALTTFNPLQLATLYNFPTNLDGTGQKIGIIELGGGYVLSDIITYFSQLGISSYPNITSVSVDGATNNPADMSGANIEVILDIEVIAAIVPKAAIFVYFGPNSYQGFYNAISAAINGGCNIISISWGAPESNWSLNTLAIYNSLFQYASTQNITILAAAGDRGSSDGTNTINVDFPSASPYVLACGGTNLKTNNDITISQEIVWNVNSFTSATGGGISKVFAKPSYQNILIYGLNNKRGVPDVAGNADPNTGYVLHSQSEGGRLIVGGTSAVSPLWSGLLGRINQSLGRSVGFVHPSIYANSSVCRDIIQGNNGFYSAGVGWDPCTGNGTPNGQLLLNLLTGNVAPIANFIATPLSGNRPLTINFTDISTNLPTNWLWNFGDNTTSIIKNPSHIYSTTGTFTVSLTVTNNTGSNTITKNNYVVVTTPPPIPMANFTGTPLSGIRPLVVNFTDTSTNLPTRWAWNFGDNTTGSTKNPSHVYSKAGIYTVRLVVTNNAGTNSIIKTNYVTVTNPPLPQIAFNGTPLSGNRQLTVNFIDVSTNSPNRWIWNFGDGSTSTSKNPSHRYTRRGRYSVSLRAYNSNGSNILTKTNYIIIN